MDTPFATTSYTEELTRNQQARSVGDVLQNDPAAPRTILSLFAAPDAAPQELTRFDRTYLRTLYKLPRTAFAEDKAILEAIHANEQRMPERRTIKIAIDISPRRMRRLVDDMVGSEAGAA